MTPALAGPIIEGVACPDLSRELKGFSARRRIAFPSAGAMKVRSSLPKQEPVYWEPSSAAM